MDASAHAWQRDGEQHGGDSGDKRGRARVTQLSTLVYVVSSGWPRTTAGIWTERRLELTIDW
jgi:hypothetical protein